MLQLIDLLLVAIQEKYGIINVVNFAAHKAPSIHLTLTVASVDQIDDFVM